MFSRKPTAEIPRKTLKRNIERIADALERLVLAYVPFAPRFALEDGGYGFVWEQINGRGYLRPVQELKALTLDSLIGLERQKASLLDNTRHFFLGRPAQNALLWGARGAGKTSLICSVYAHLCSEHRDKKSKLASCAFAIG